MKKDQDLKQNAEQNADQNLLDQLVGDIRLGERYYVFTVSYAYIGAMKKLTDELLILEDACIVMNAGGASDAVSKIVQGKANPEVYEWPGKPVLIRRAAITCLIPSARPK